MSTPKNKKPVIWTHENTEPDPPKDDVYPPLRRTHKDDDPGGFRIRQAGATIENGWDVKGEWEQDGEHGLVILNIGYVPAEYVTDGCPLGRARLRLASEPQGPPVGFRFKDLATIKLSRVREAIRERLEGELAPGGFYYTPEDYDPPPLVRKQIDVVTSAVADRPKTGRPRTGDAVLDQWARDVIECLSDRSAPLYEQLADLWDVSESLVRNHRLRQLRDTGRLTGKGRQMFKGPNYPRDKETDDAS